MRWLSWGVVVVLMAACATGQQPPAGPEPPQPPRIQDSVAPSEQRPHAADPITIPAGTKVPLVLKQAISTKSARVGDAVYAQTNFPVAQDGRIVLPPGTYVQGVISSIKRAGRVKGRAEVLFHFTTLIFPSGYTVLLPGSVENVPGAENSNVKDQEGTIQRDSEKGKDVGQVAGTAATGAVIGSIASQSGKGAGIGAGVGGATGLAIALLTRGSDVRLENGTGIEMVISRPITLDGSRINSRPVTWEGNRFRR